MGNISKGRTLSQPPWQYLREEALPDEMYSLLLSKIHLLNPDNRLGFRIRSVCFWSSILKRQYKYQ